MEDKCRICGEKKREQLVIFDLKKTYSLICRGCADGIYKEVRRRKANSLFRFKWKEDEGNGNIWN